MVYSTLDALRIAAAEPGREVVFFAIGFETTTPPTAMAMRLAAREAAREFHGLLQPRADAAGDPAHPGKPRHRRARPGRDRRLIGPAHVSTVIGTQPYEFFAEEFDKPVVIAGFEPLDVMQSILMLVRQVNEGRARGREPVHPRGDPRRQPARQGAKWPTYSSCATSFEWRGLGLVPYSGLRLQRSLCRASTPSGGSAWQRPSAADNPACECGAILRGVKKPVDCQLFGTVCTPETPMGSCMVSSEGACAAHWTYGRFRDMPAARVVSSKAFGASSTSGPAAWICRTAPAAGRWRS